MSSGFGGVPLNDLAIADGAAAQTPGNAQSAARGDHVHRVVTPATVPGGQSGAGTVGAAGLGARADHGHPVGDLLRSIGFYYPQPPSINTAAGFQPVAGELHAIYYDTPGETLAELAMNVTTLDAAGVIRLGLWYPDANNKPGARAADFGTFTTASTGFKSLTPNVVLPAGLYFLAFLCEAGGLEQFTQPSSGTDWRIGTSALQTALAKSYKATGVAAGAIPNPAPAMALGTTSTPLIWTRRSA